MTVDLQIPTEGLVVQAAEAAFALTPIVLDHMNDDEVLVEMKYSGICHTDILLQKGLLPFITYPAVFGHEGAGTVLRVGSAAAQRNPALQPGATVLLSFNTCGKCSECASNRPSYCPDQLPANTTCRRVSDGSSPSRLAASPTLPVSTQCFGQSSFMRKSVVAERSVVVVPPALLDGDPARLAAYAPLGCGLQTGAGTVLNVLQPGPDDSVVIFGMGSVGLAALMAAKYRSVRQLIAVDVVDDKLAAAKTFGATDTLNSRGLADVPAAIRALSAGGSGVTYALDCTGLVVIIDQLLLCVKPGGTAVSVGVPPPGQKVQIDALSFLMENKRFIGVIEGGSWPQKFIPELIQLHRDGHFPIDQLCKVYPATQFEQALSDMRSGKVIKPVIQWSVEKRGLRVERRNRNSEGQHSAESVSLILFD